MTAVGGGETLTTDEEGGGDDSDDDSDYGLWSGDGGVGTVARR